jgi:hypothetical protein
MVGGVVEIFVFFTWQLQRPLLLRAREKEKKRARNSSMCEKEREKKSEKKKEPFETYLVSFFPTSLLLVLLPS